MLTQKIFTTLGFSSASPFCSSCSVASSEDVSDSGLFRRGAVNKKHN